MFSKIRKHFNIVIIFALFYVVLAILLMISEIAFHKSAYDEIVKAQSTYNSNMKNRVNDVVIEAVQNISLYEKNHVINSASSKSAVMNKTLEEIKALKPTYTVKNILLYTDQEEYYNYGNNGVGLNANNNDLKWKDGLDKNYEPKVSFFYDKDSSENYFVVSEKIDASNLIVAICYDAKEISDTVFIAEEGKFALVNNKIAVLSNTASDIGQNIYKHDKVYGEQQDEIEGLSDETKKMKINRKDYYVSSSDFYQGNKFISIVEADNVGGKIDSYFYKNIVYIIIVTIIVVMAFVNSYFVNQKINNVIDSKFEYIDNISNDLKRSLITIDESANALFNEQNKDKIEDKAKVITSVSKLMGFKLNSAVSYAKMSKYDFKNEKGEYTAVEMMNDVRSIVGSEIKRNNIYLDIEIESDDRLKFYGDTNQVQAAIVNLLLWSIDRTVQGGIEVVFTCDEIFADKTNFTVKVKDTSAGMEEGEVAKIQELVLNKKRKANLAETGNGLEVVGLVLKNLKGKFEINSTKNVGTEVVMKIPQVALLNTDESFLRQQREQREKAEEEQLNSSFWSGVDTNSGGQNREDGEQLTLGEMKQDNSDMLTLSDMGADSQNNNITNTNNMTMGNQYVQAESAYTPQPESAYVPQSESAYTPQPESAYTPQPESAYTPQPESAYTPQAESTYTSQVESTYASQPDETYNNDDAMNKEQDNISIDEMNKKYIEMMNSNVPNTESESEQKSPYYQTDTINSMRLNTLYVDESINEEKNIISKKKEKMYIYLKEDSINVDDGLDAVGKDIEEYEKVLKEFYNYSHKNVKGIILLWNEKKVDEYYIEITKITTPALSIGANKLYNMLCEQQKNYNEKDMMALSSNVKAIFDEWKKVLLYIVEYFKN